MEPKQIWKQELRGASIVVAVLLAMLALWIRFGLAGRLSRPWAIALGGVVMGGAIAGMHYTAMGAARFVGLADGPCNTSIENAGWLALWIAGPPLFYRWRARIEGGAR